MISITDLNINDSISLYELLHSIQENSESIVCLIDNKTIHFYSPHTLPKDLKYINSYYYFGVNIHKYQNSNGISEYLFFDNKLEEYSSKKVTVIKFKNKKYKFTEHEYFPETSIIY